MSEFETRSISTLEAVVNHVVLPIRTPDRLEDLSLVHEELVNRSIATTKTIRDTGKAEEYQQWDILRRLLVTCKELNMSEGLNKATIMKSLENIEHGSLVILYVKEQNAGIIVRRYVILQTLLLPRDEFSADVPANIAMEKSLLFSNVLKLRLERRIF